VHHLVGSVAHVLTRWGQCSVRFWMFKNFNFACHGYNKCIIVVGCLNWLQKSEWM
jgi:hypothetical protein